MILKKRKKNGGPNNCETYNKTTVINTVWYWQTHRAMG